MLSWAQYYPRNAVYRNTLCNTQKHSFVPTACNFFWLVQDIPYSNERANPALHLVQRSSLGSLWKGSEVRVKVSPSLRKSVTFVFVLQQLFLIVLFSFLFCQLSLFLTITSFCRVSLTLALLAPNFAHALIMPPPLPSMP
jgi:hypothetical protein